MEALCVLVVCGGVIGALSAVLDAALSSKVCHRGVAERAAEQRTLTVCVPACQAGWCKQDAATFDPDSMQWLCEKHGKDAAHGYNF